MDKVLGLVADFGVKTNTLNTNKAVKEICELCLNEGNTHCDRCHLSTLRYALGGCIAEDVVNGEYGEPICPVCGEEVELKVEDHDCFYCRHCGQHLYAPIRLLEGEE